MSTLSHSSQVLSRHPKLPFMYRFRDLSWPPIPGLQEGWRGYRRSWGLSQGFFWWKMWRRGRDVSLFPYKLGFKRPQEPLICEPSNLGDGVWRPLEKSKGLKTGWYSLYYRAKGRLQTSTGTCTVREREWRYQAGETWHHCARDLLVGDFLGNVSTQNSNKAHREKTSP